MPFKLTPRFVLPVLFILYALNYMDRSALGILGEAIQADMGFSDSQMGLLHSLLLIALLFFIIPCAALNDIFGRRKMLSLAATIWSGAMFLTGTAGSFGALVIARLMGSSNDAFTGAGSAAWLSWVYPPEKRGKMLGIFHMCAPFGMAMGTLLGGVALYLTNNWRVAFFALIVPGLATAFLITRLPDAKPAPAKGYFVGVPHVLKTRTIIIAGVACGLYSILVFSHQAWAPALLMRNYDLSSGSVSILFAGLLLAGMISPFLGGSISDWWNKRSPNGRVKAAALCTVAGATMKLIFYCSIGKVSLPVACSIGLLDGFFTLMPTPVYFSLVQDVAEDRYKSIATGIMGSIGFLAGGAYGPVLVGLLSDAFGGGASGVRLAMITLTIAGFSAAALVYATLHRRYVQEKI